MEDNVVFEEVEAMDNNDDGVEIYDLAPTGEKSSNGKAVAAVIGGIGLAVAGAIVGGKALIENRKEKKLEKALELVMAAGYNVSDPEDVDDDMTLEPLEPEAEETSEEKQEDPKRNKKRR